MSVSCWRLNKYSPLSGRQCSAGLRLEGDQPHPTRSGEQKLKRIWNLLASGCLFWQATGLSIWTGLSQMDSLNDLKTLLHNTPGRLNGIVKLCAVEAAMGQLPSAAESSSRALPISISAHFSKFSGINLLAHYALKEKEAWGLRALWVPHFSDKTPQKLMWKARLLK